MVLAEDYLLFYLERTFLDYFRLSTAGLGAMIFFGPEGSEFDGEYAGFDLTEPAIYLRCKLSF